jgi:hypothetical protein
MTDTGKCPAFGYDCEYVAKVEAQAAEIDIAQKVILEQLKARKEQADEIERLRQILVDAVEIINDQMPGEFPEWEIYAKSALGETE